MINKILFITLSNIGDVILTLPALDILRANFPESKITVIVSPRPRELFENNPYINRIIVYDKHSKLKEKIKLFFKLRQENFDLVIDLRNSLFGALLPAKYKTSPFLIVPKNIRHMKARHLCRLPEVVRGCQRLSEVAERKSIWINAQDEEYINQILKENQISENDTLMVVSSGARSHIKRWARERFVELISTLSKEFLAKIILVGDKDDVPITKYINEHFQNMLIDLSGKTNIAQLACLLKKSKLLITNDSAVLHLGSYLNIPIVAIFGPTDETKYGPWSDNFVIVKKDIFCRPCEKAQCKFGTLDCLRIIKIEDVLRPVRNMLVTSYQLPVTSQKNNFQRILIVRTDRIGDVLLSTPVIKALRDAYPYAYIAMMVSPYSKDIVEGNPCLDEVIIYDKDNRHKNWFSSMRFAQKLKKKRFDLTIVLHPTNRVHLVTFFAGIPRRIGYDKKLGLLLSDRIKHTKEWGEKHELEYNLDLVRYLGIEPQDKNLFMPIKLESEVWVKNIFSENGIGEQDKLLAIHPGASCPSKIWPNERFAEVADRLIEKYNFKVLLLTGPRDIGLADNVVKHMRHPVVNLAGKTSVSQLASVLKRCRLFISNDSGPVHIGSSLGTAVISIFGRNQRGLSPLRWGPTGKNVRVIHKEVGCIECLAHNCVKEFLCLKAITVEDVLNTVDLILNL